MLNIKEKIIPTIEIAEYAGQAIMEVYSDPERFISAQVQTKIDSSPVTLADLVAHKIIEESLQRMTPEWGVISEESKYAADFTNQQTVWLVDPLDGTKEFLSRTNEFTVNIALIHQQRPIFGVVHAPALNVTYWGYSLPNQPPEAFKKSANGVQQIHVSVAHPNQPQRIVASKSHLNEATVTFIQQWAHHQLIQIGSSLKFCIIAEGGADIYPRLAPTSEWDTAAAHAILVAAGGYVFDSQGNDLLYNKQNILNPHFVAANFPIFGS